jgi:regulation of enolase protein 1 (concanavalin A-like superfamily)
MSTLNENFTGALDPRLHWYCEPARWQTSAGGLRVETDAETDFWQRTHYGFQADNGHFLFAEVAGNFVMETRVVLHPVNQYDQAGLMVRLSPDCWLKTSVEYEPDAHARLGAVVTNNGYSDWSTQDVEGVGEMHFRVTREEADYIVEASCDGQAWTQLRVAHLHEDRGQSAVQAGLYACSPKGAGFVAEFQWLSITPGCPGTPTSPKSGLE